MKTLLIQNFDGRKFSERYNTEDFHVEEIKGGNYLFYPDDIKDPIQEECDPVVEVVDKVDQVINLLKEKEIISTAEADSLKS